MQVLRQAPPTCRNPVHCDGCSCAPDTRASLKARFAHASALALPEGWDLLIRDGELVVGRYGRPVGAVMVCECCGHEFLGDPNGARLCNRNDCVAAFVKMHVDRTVRALGPTSAAPDADEGADIAALEAQLMEKRRELSRRTGASQGLAPPGSA